MPTLLIVEQLLNGLQFGLMLFLLAAGLTLVFGVMDMINLAHGSLYMVGAFLAAWLVAKTGSFVWGVLGAIGLTAAFGMLLETTLLRTLYARDHLSQVLATFALILILNDGVKMVFGTDLPLSAPDALAGPVQLLPGLSYPAYRLLILGVGLVLALAMYLLVAKTRLGALVRAGAANRVMTEAMGINVQRLFTVVFGIGAGLCAVAGALLGPLLAVQVGMGENILILAFVVIVIGGIGSIRGALIGSILVGCVDTLGARCCSSCSASSCRRNGPARPVRQLRRSRSTCSWRGCSRCGRKGCSRLGPERGRRTHSDPPARACCTCGVRGVCVGVAMAARRAGRAVLHQLRRPGAGVRDRCDQSQPRARLRRHGVVRPRGLRGARSLRDRRDGQ